MFQSAPLMGTVTRTLTKLQEIRFFNSSFWHLVMHIQSSLDLMIQIYVTGMVTVALQQI